MGINNRGEVNMVGFSMKPAAAVTSEGEGGGSDITNDQWAGWNEYLHSLITTAETEGKTDKFSKSKSFVGVLNFIMDMGYQPQRDGEWDTKVALPAEGEENSAEELEVIAKWPSNYYKWVEDKGVKKRKQYSPQRPEQEYAFFFDFPKIMVDWTKHPSEDAHKLGMKPLRISYNGKFGKPEFVTFNKTLPFRTDRDGKLSPKNPIHKIAAAVGVVDSFIESGYDLGTLVQGACHWTVTFNRNVSGERTFYNTMITEPRMIEDVEAGEVVITRDQQIPKCDVEFVGIHLNGGDYNEEAMKYLKNRKELLTIVKRAVSFQPSPEKYPDFVLGADYADSDLCKALGGSNSTGDAPKGDDKPSSPAKQQSVPVAPKSTAKAPVVAVKEPDVDEFEDSDIPF